MRLMNTLGCVASLLLMSACGGGETPQPGGLARSETDALNDAAEMLDKANNGQSDDD